MYYYLNEKVIAVNRSYKNLESIKSIIIGFPVVSDNRNDYKRVHKIKINQDVIIDSLTLENLFFIITKKFNFCGSLPNIDFRHFGTFGISETFRHFGCISEYN